MERIVRGRSATLTQTFTFTPTGTPTVTYVRVSDGTTVTTGGVSGAGTAWTVTIPASSNTLLDTYAETWTAVSGGTAQTFTDYVEVAGGRLFTVAEARAVGLSDVQYTDAQIEGIRLLVEQKFERICSRAFVPRYTLESVSPSQPLLKFPDVLAIRSITRAGVALTPTTDYAWISGGLGYVNHGYYSTSTDLVVGYEYGMPILEEPVRGAALQEAKQSLTVGTSGSDPRIVSFTTDDGSVRYSDVSQGAGFLSQDANWVASNYDMAVRVA